MVAEAAAGEVVKVLLEAVVITVQVVQFVLFGQALAG